ncbi:sugar diacid utilization regulator [Mycolicibacterium wolinskyi]|uniref:Sugar diacid utilization regulator n=1 Tax=Mycolicibacterium wolinskyi TaxID=59750 RepID=A0A132PKL6_9MYCO|nr:sugar diacid recognition domain-containing protein [Mycolicibacterium wolinskyi]KWX22843.1 sugar diacid utilization regulator [Mycolicibacterium wolinskyi]
MLGQALAQQIANEITDVIGYNVMISDESGIVVGSGDTSRIGQFHEASVEVIRSRRTMTHSSADVQNLVGTLPGVTTPLVIDDVVVGTVGLSGPPEEVERFGLVVKRQTEILMQEAARIGSRVTRERAVTELLRDVCEWHHSRIPAAQLLRRARTLGHDLTLPRRMVLVASEDPDGSRYEVDSAQLMRHTEAVFNSTADLIAPLAGTVIAVATPDDPDGGERSVLERCEELVAVTRTQHLGTRVAIGSAACGVEELNVSARDAFDAMQLGSVVTGQQPIRHIEHFRLQQALSVVPIDSRTRLTESLLRPLLHDREWPTLRATLISWGDCAFNVTKAAAAMHVHRNTLIYRLDRVARLLGRSLDEAGLAVALYVTCMMDQLGRGPNATRP